MGVIAKIRCDKMRHGRFLYFIGLRALEITTVSVHHWSLRDIRRDVRGGTATDHESYSHAPIKSCKDQSTFILRVPLV